MYTREKAAGWVATAESKGRTCKAQGVCLSFHRRQKLAQQTEEAVPCCAKCESSVVVSFLLMCFTHTVELKFKNNAFLRYTPATS